LWLIGAWYELGRAEGFGINCEWVRVQLGLKWIGCGFYKCVSCTGGVAWHLAGRDEGSGSIHVSNLVCCRNYDLVSSFVLGSRDIFGFTVIILDFG
jgi:hypothetical protein